MPLLAISNLTTNQRNLAQINSLKKRKRYTNWATTLPDLIVFEKRKLLIEWNAKVELRKNEIPIWLQPDQDGGVQSISVDAKIVRKGNELKLALSPDNKSAKRMADPSLLKLMAQAFAAREHLIINAESELVGHYSKQHLSKLARLSYVSPDIVSAITNGNQPPHITARQLLRNGNISLDWDEQRKQLGFARGDRNHPKLDLHPRTRNWPLEIKAILRLFSQG